MEEQTRQPSQTEVPRRPQAGFLVAGLVLLLSVVQSACLWETATAYAVQEEIPLGRLSISVDRWEEIRRPPVLLGTVTAVNHATQKLVAVFVRWEGLQDHAELDQRAHVQSVLTRRLQLGDSNGFRYAARAALPRALYEGTDSSAAPRDWVVLFQVWRPSLGYSLRVQHPDPGPRTFRSAVVQLSIEPATRPLLAGQPSGGFGSQ